MLPQAEGLATVESTDNGILLAPRNKDYALTESWELGGVGLSDTSQGLVSHTWRAWTDSKAIYIQRSDLPKDTAKTLLAAPDITEVDLTFDQNMRPVLAYVSGGIAKTVLVRYGESISNHHRLSKCPKSTCVVR